MNRALAFIVFAALAVLSAAQSIDWNGPEAVALGQPYTVSVSCIEAATVVLLKNGTLAASGPSWAAVTTTESEAATVTFTVHAYGGSLEEAATDQFSVEVLIEEHPAAVVPRNDDDEGSTIVEVSSPVAAETP
jgi:hypothetical protein